MLKTFYNTLVFGCVTALFAIAVCASPNNETYKMVSDGDAYSIRGGACELDVWVGGKCKANNEGCGLFSKKCPLDVFYTPNDEGDDEHVGLVESYRTVNCKNPCGESCGGSVNKDLVTCSN